MGQGGLGAALEPGALAGRGQPGRFAAEGAVELAEVVEGDLRFGQGGHARLQGRLGQVAEHAEPEAAIGQRPELFFYRLDRGAQVGGGGQADREDAS